MGLIFLRVRFCRYGNRNLLSYLARVIVLRVLSFRMFFFRVAVVFSCLCFIYREFSRCLFCFDIVRYFGGEGVLRTFGI